MPKYVLVAALLSIAAIWDNVDAVECGDPVLCPEIRCPDGLPAPVGASCCNDIVRLVLPAFKPNPAGEEEKNVGRNCGVAFRNGMMTGLFCGEPAIVPGEDQCGTIPEE